MKQQPDFSVDTNAGAIRTVIFIVEIKYILSNNVAIHTENCKLEIALDCTPNEVEKTIRQKTGIEESSSKRGFVNFILEVIYIDFVEPGNPRNTLFVH